MEASLVRKRGALLDERVERRRATSRAERCFEALRERIENDREEEEDAFFLRNDLLLGNEEFERAVRVAERLQIEGHRARRSSPASA